MISDLTKYPHAQTFNHTKLPVIVPHTTHSICVCNLQSQIKYPTTLYESREMLAVAVIWNAALLLFFFFLHYYTIDYIVIPMLFALLSYAVFITCTCSCTMHIYFYYNFIISITYIFSIYITTGVANYSQCAIAPIRQHF